MRCAGERLGWRKLRPKCLAFQKELSTALKALLWPTKLAGGPTFIHSWQAAAPGFYQNGIALGFNGTRY